MMKAIAILILTAMMSLADSKENPKESPMVLEGLWKGIEVWEGKKKEPAKSVKGMSIEFRKNAFTILKDGRKVSGFFELAETKAPIAIDLRITLDDKKLTIPAICKLESGILTLCHANGEGGERPTSFKIQDGVVVASFQKHASKKSTQQGGSPKR